MIVVLHQFKVRGAIIISILVITVIATTALGLKGSKGVVGQVPSIAPTFMQMDFEGLFTASMVGRDFCLLYCRFI